MDKYNKDELEAPEWLNRNFLEKVLRQSEKSDDVKVTNFEVGPATEKGNHFASIMFRISVDYLISDKSKNISLILKTMPVVEGAKMDLMNDSFAFETEIKMYSETIPKFHKILREIGDETILGARMIYSSLKPIKIIIFEDLKVKGYNVLPNKYLEPYEIDALLAKICRWHAISFKLLKEGDESIKEFKHKNYDVPEVKVIFERSINGFSKMLVNHFDPIYNNKFDKIKGQLFEKARSLYSFEGDLCVLNHGDFSVNNILVRMDQNNTIDDLMLVDFQFCTAATLASDLGHLLHAIINPNSKDQHDQIIYEYHKQFIDILQKLGYKGKIPTLIDIRMEMMRCKELEMMVFIIFAPFLCAVKDNVEIDNRLIEDPNFFVSFYERPNYVNVMKQMMPDLLYRGYLN